MKRLTLSYLAGYLFFGGVALAFFPGLALSLLGSNGSYGDVMPRVAGVLMIGLSGLIAQFAYFKDYRYYGYSILIRTFFVIFFFVLFARTSDPFFVVLNAIILVGLLPSIFTWFRAR